ncbi:hypothetical protein JRO89_XSUnG0194600 [Xanthoceras sorbifolium]|uniref:Protein kinase domain-containing protein n=1 Tax=Xanthoceras sorbifolium TaxID=99658 RepID=A0ABQ8GXB2_9ROSI|nr:hypothetical protein JRO89_XSUnG0194600 [Xanthoceras sorbifolium]
MANEGLKKWLHLTLETGEELLEIQSLTLLRRARIAIDVAFVLDYLPHHSEEPILHCDLKPSNVLLNDDMIAHVGDFGLACKQCSLASLAQSGHEKHQIKRQQFGDVLQVKNDTSAVDNCYLAGILADNWLAAHILFTCNIRLSLLEMND